jgi:NAD-dependent deacetylase
VTARGLPRLPLDEKTRVLVLTGAGVSAESGLPTFRDANGLWEQHPVEEVASPEGFAKDPSLVWRFYSQRRKGAAGVEPNAGHLALARLEERLGDNFLLATQNVDGLHQRAGSRRVLELHGSLVHTKCARCDRPPFFDPAPHDDALPECELCAKAGRRALLRPDIVWFGEMLDPSHFERIDAFLRGGEKGRQVFLAVGTSGVVYPAAGLVMRARGFGADTWLINVEPSENADAFAHFVQGRSAQLLPPLLGLGD